MDDREMTERGAPMAGRAARIMAPVVNIRALGGFAVTVDGAPLAFARKAPKKPLALLKAIVALGAPCVCTYRLADALWPDLEADAAHQAFNMALHRLRRLLRRNDAVIFGNGRVGLDAGLCAADVWAFERLAARAQAAEPRDPAALLAAALALYRGPFLGDEQGERWSIATAERLRTRFVALVDGQARRLEGQGRGDEALRFYRLAAEVEPGADVLDQGVARAVRRLGRETSMIG
jgi:LuxR family maltose regulon positive regulatory protein